MKLTLLCDNHTYIDRYYLGEPAFSCLIEDGKNTVLFDTGYSDVFLENMRRMELDPAKVTHVAVSHGHNDHTGGLEAFSKAVTQRVALVAHPMAFSRRVYEGLEVGAPVQPDALGKNFEFLFSESPVWIGENICFLGAVPRRYGFENGRAVGELEREDGTAVPDELPDDSSLALKTENGLFLVTGCAHAGIANTLAYAKEVTGETRVAGVLGGMHLFETDAAFDACCEELGRLGMKKVWPCHCTSLKVKAALMQRFETEEAGVGLVLGL